MGMIIRFRGGDLFSPGYLSAMNQGGQSLSGAFSHAEFEEECSRCHVPWRGVSSDLCLSCHEDVADQRLSGSGLHGRLPNSGKCSQCHVEHLGRSASVTKYDLSAFEHDLLTDFTLVLHQEDYDQTTVECVDCHPDGHFESRQVTCQECHLQANPQFTDNHSRFYGDDCKACHDGQEVVAIFDHQLIFPLDGGHIEAECTDCHQQPILSGTPIECFECHDEPELHLGQFGLKCQRCHVTSAWTPAHLNYHNFPLDHGRDSQSECSTCHLANYQTYTCYSCHDHEPGQILALHKAKGVVQIEDCVSCHPTGSEEDLVSD
jgi:hypothetical protein